MFDIIGRLLGTDKAMSTAVTGLRDGLDALVYTDEEKATDALVERSEARQMVVRWMEATQGQNLARRLIALTVTGIWVFQYFIAMVMDVAVIWVDDIIVANNISASAEVIGARASQMNGAMMLVLGFYFAANHLGKITEVAMNKFNRGKL